jgi:hypothetical protein
MTPEERDAIQTQLHPSLRGELLLLEDIPHMTDEQVDALFPNFVPVWRGFLREVAQQAESESA